ncbi:MAG: hypothetical protein HY922_08770 [Elusimicrobia bacterium]|nr:hypothetical protein [Elusimicrobiota bacterium]
MSRTQPPRMFHIKRSERCYRLKPEALRAHAPRRPGVYELLSCDAKGGPEVLYVGLALPQTIYERLAAHLMGNVRPTADELRQSHPNVYFDFIAEADIESQEELRDIAGALMIRHNPRHNLLQNPPSSGKHHRVDVMEA